MYNLAEEQTDMNRALWFCTQTKAARRVWCGAGIVLLLAASAPGVTYYYVNAARPNDSGNGLTWATAKQTIQAAVDLAASGDTVWVTNGVYTLGGRPAPGSTLSNRVCISKPITVRSVNGWTGTTIQGAGPYGSAAVRCAFLSNSCTLTGFTLSGGYTASAGDVRMQCSGGGVIIYGSCSLVNCRVQNSRASWLGGGAFVNNGGTLNNVTFFGNVAGLEGGGAWLGGGATMRGGAFTGNDAKRGGGAQLHDASIRSVSLAQNGATESGGGLYLSDGARGYDLTFSNNTAGDRGGGAHLLGASVISNATFYYNEAATNGGGVFLTTNCFVYNALMHKNTARNEGGGAYLNGGGALHSCTIASNRAARGGGVTCYSKGSNVNCIIYYNLATIEGNNHYGHDTGMRYVSCCLTPYPSGPQNAGGNITNAPQFVNVSDNYHLNANSPCIDAGTNLPWMAGAEDLDGNPRIYDGRVDMGCYEFIPEPASWGVLGLFAIYKLRFTIWQRRRRR
jgi:hypothetical protein